MNATDELNIANDKLAKKGSTNTIYLSLRMTLKKKKHRALISVLSTGFHLLTRLGNPWEDKYHTLPVENNLTRQDSWPEKIIYFSKA